MNNFIFNPSKHVPFRDVEILKKIRKIRYEDFLKHPNPNLNIKIFNDNDISFHFVTDIFFRIKNAMENDRKLVLIIPQPWPDYKKVAYLINKAKINCHNLYTFNMDEYADENGNIAPEDWPSGFTYAMKKYFYNEIDPTLRPPQKQMTGITNTNFKDYGKMISDLGGADVCYQGPGWTGHLAFVEPDAPEVPNNLESFKEMGPTIVTLSPFTIAQNSLHGSFGYAGDLAAIPPKAATIGPAQSLEAKHRIGFYSITISGTSVSWQKLITRLSLFGPITPKVPDSIVQLKPSEIWVSKTIAQNIEPDWELGY